MKVLKLPKRREKMTPTGLKLLRQSVKQITTDFVTEIEITCDLSHPNLVQLLGYADKPSLLIMQELLEGNSIDDQLCVTLDSSPHFAHVSFLFFVSPSTFLPPFHPLFLVRLLHPLQLLVECLRDYVRRYREGWKPTEPEIVKVALDVALGMEYLHTRFEHEYSKAIQPSALPRLSSVKSCSHVPALAVLAARARVLDLDLNRALTWLTHWRCGCLFALASQSSIETSRLPIFCSSAPPATRPRPNKRWNSRSRLPTSVSRATRDSTTELAR